jgi:hypothetical protein
MSKAALERFELELASLVQGHDGVDAGSKATALEELAVALRDEAEPASTPRFGRRV